MGKLMHLVFKRDQIDEVQFLQVFHPTELLNQIPSRSSIQFDVLNVQNSNLVHENGRLGENAGHLALGFS